MVTVEVSPVAPNHTRLEVLSTSEAIPSYLNHSVEACAATADSLVARVGYHPFVAASHLAFAQHRELVLTPDAIWLVLVQALAQHVSAHAEELRPRFVSHEGKIQIEVKHDGIVRGNPDSPWHEVLSLFSTAIREHVGPEKHALLVGDFSTTGPVERSASEVVLMDVVKSYFDYKLITKCGIPRIHLEGTSDDWRAVRERASYLSEFGLESWVAALLPVLDRFVDAVEGRSADPAFWRSYIKQNDASGGPYITGWINVFFPYIDGKRSPYSDLAWAESVLHGDFDGASTHSFSSGVSKVPFKWDYLDKKIDMEFLAGFVGFSQGEGAAIRPEIGWAVREPRDDSDAFSPDRPETHDGDFDFNF